MNKFYQVLTPYYDEIFPSNDKQISFLSACFPISSTLLDVGAGTGNTAVALAKAGYILTAAEPEHSMTVKIKEKATHGQLPIQVVQNSMQQISQLSGAFDGIYCIGNTLAHLDSFKEISAFLQAAYDLLNEQGMLVIQAVNFEKVILHQDFSFPVIQKDTFTFTRKYEPLGTKILFTTILEDPLETYSNTLSLYPVTKAQLQNELLNCGFHSIAVYGDYGKSPYTTDSPGLIITAIK